MGQFAQWMQLGNPPIGQRAAWLRGLPVRGQVLLEHAERGASATVVHVPHLCRTATTRIADPPGCQSRSAISSFAAAAVWCW